MPLCAYVYVASGVQSYSLITECLSRGWIINLEKNTPELLFTRRALHHRLNRNNGTLREKERQRECDLIKGLKEKMFRSVVAHLIKTILKPENGNIFRKQNMCMRAYKKRIRKLDCIVHGYKANGKFEKYFAKNSEENIKDGEKKEEEGGGGQKLSKHVHKIGSVNLLPWVCS